MLIQLNSTTLLTLRGTKMDHVCIVCGHVHDEATEGKWDELPETFECPDCGVGKADYEEMAF